MNMSRMHVYETGFVARVNKIVNKYNIPPYLLEFELTETVILKIPAYLLTNKKI